jgi:hypothetical protein
MYTHIKTVSPTVAPPDPRGPWFSQTYFCAMSESFQTFSCFGQVVLGKEIFKIFFPI